MTPSHLPDGNCWHRHTDCNLQKAEWKCRPVCHQNPLICMCAMAEADQLCAKELARTHRSGQSTPSTEFRRSHCHKEGGEIERSVRQLLRRRCVRASEAARLCAGTRTEYEVRRTCVCASQQKFLTTNGQTDAQQPNAPPEARTKGGRAPARTHTPNAGRRPFRRCPSGRPAPKRSGTAS